MACTILLVDDSTTIRMIVKKTVQLSGLDATCIEAGTGEAALAALREGHAVDLILADINMPGMGGVELVKRLKSGPHAAIPIVMVTTEGAEARIEELQQLGIAGFIRKPFTPEAMSEVVKPILEQSDDA